MINLIKRAIAQNILNKIIITIFVKHEYAYNTKKRMDQNFSNNQLYIDPSVQLNRIPENSQF